MSDRRTQFRLEQSRQKGFDFLGDEYSVDVEEVWDEARSFNRDVFGSSGFESLGKPSERISIHEVANGRKKGLEATFTWPDGEENFGGVGDDISEALYLLYADLVTRHAPHNPDSPMNRRDAQGHEPEDVLTDIELAWRDEALAASIGKTLDPPQPRKVSPLTALYQSAVSAFVRGSYTSGADLLEKADSQVGIDTDSRMQVRKRNGTKKNKTKMRKNSTSGLSLYANPYDNSTGFYFSTWEDFEKKYTAKYKKSGTEEYEIDFIDGDPIEQKLFKTMKVDHGNLGTFFTMVEELEDLDDGQRVGLLWLMEDRLVDVDQAIQNAENVMVFEGEPSDYAESLIEEMGDIPDDLAEMYFDYDAFGRDLRISGDDIMSTEEEIENLQDGDKDDKKEAKKLQKWVESIEEMDDDDRAREFIDSIGGLTEAVDPQQIARYFDYEAWARDMGFNGEIDTFHLDGTDYVITNASEH